MSRSRSESRLDPWFLENLACPRDRLTLKLEGDELVSSKGRRYPVVDGIPVMLLDETDQTIGVARASLDRAWKRPGSIDGRAPRLYLESLGISEQEKQGVIKAEARGDARVDPVVQYLVAATSGNLYSHLRGRLEDYPIPELRMPSSPGRLFLDLGCSWGRWSVAAARRGYSVVGIDPSLGAVMAARRVSRQLGLGIRYLVGDARFLPLRPSLFHAVFSYSVLQHLGAEDASGVLQEISRVLAPGGKSLIQMANAFGTRSLFHQVRRGFRQPGGFEVRYWTPPEMVRAFRQALGRSFLSVDCFLGLGLQPADLGLMNFSGRTLIRLSEMLRRASRALPFLLECADSLYVTSIRRMS